VLIIDKQRVLALLLVGVPAFGLAAVRSFRPSWTTSERGRDVVVWLVVFFAAQRSGSTAAP
jgi:hypothetical protein